MRVNSCRSALVALVIMGVSYASYAQTAGIPNAPVDPELAARQANLDLYYQYRFALSGGLLQLSPLVSFSDDSEVAYTATDISFAFNYPLPDNPIIQPLARAGWMSVDYEDTRFPTRWDHSRVYGGLGATYASRFSKEFEFGADVALGMSQTYFPELTSQEETYGNKNLHIDLGGKIALNPSYQMSIQVMPTVKFMYSFGPLDKFNGIAFGIGFGVQYRHGEDPDAPEAQIRSIRFVEAEVDPLFAAMQSYYVNHPVGTVTIENVEDFPITEIEVAFFQDGFMDGPTAAARIPQMAPGENLEVDLFAAFNGEVFSTEGITPLNGEVQVAYRSRDRAADQAFSVSYDLYDKTSLTWNDDRKVCAFITPADGALRNFTSYVRQATNAHVTDGLSPKLQMAMQVYYALQEQGILYQPDPTTPFTAMQNDPFAVDSVSIARDTLRRTTGDCDDLTVAYTSLLETLGIQTGIITTPGHVYAVFNTGVPARNQREVHPDPSLTFELEGELWVPVEITLVGQASFLEAWRTGMAEYRAWEEQPDVRGLYRTAAAQELYRPIGLREADTGIQYGSPDQIVARFQSGLAEIVDESLESYRVTAEQGNIKRDWNQYGIAAAKFNRYDEAETAFEKALELDRNYLGAQINLGNLAYLRGEYQTALRRLHRVENTLESAGRTTSSSYTTVLLNISQSYYQLENYARASQYYERLAEVDPDLAKSYSHLQRGSLGGTLTGETDAG